VRFGRSFAQILTISKMANTFVERLQAAIGPTYELWMRRSVQTAILYEAKRITDSLLGMTAEARGARPSPKVRNYVLMTQTKALVQSLPFADPGERQEIMWRTATSQAPIDETHARKRLQLVARHVPELALQLQPHVDPTKSQNEMVDALVTSLFVSVPVAVRHYGLGRFTFLTNAL
jgi:hypothetical protein